jgi:hypothetical protein
MFKQMNELNKTAFDNSFSFIKIVYEQNEKVVLNFLDQATWMPETGKNAVKEWQEVYRKGFEQYKELVDHSYAKVEAIFEESEE